MKAPTPAEIETLHRQLGEIPALYADLPTIDEPDRAAGGEPNDEPGHAAPAPSPPINLTVVHLADTRLKAGWRHHNPGRCATIERFGVLPALMWWTLYVEGRMTTLGATPPPTADPATVDSECAWLQAAHLFVLAQPWARLLCRDVHRIHTRLTETVTGKREYIPRCGTCPNTILDPQDAGSWYKCSTCNREYTPGSMSDLGRRQPPLPGKQIAALLGIPWSTFRNWDDRGLLKAERRDGKGRKLYALADAKRVHERVRT